MIVKFIKSNTVSSTLQHKTSTTNTLFETLLIKIEDIDNLSINIDMRKQCHCFNATNLLSYYAYSKSSLKITCLVLSLLWIDPQWKIIIIIMSKEKTDRPKDRLVTKLAWKPWHSFMNWRLLFFSKFFCTIRTEKTASYRQTMSCTHTSAASSQSDGNIYNFTEVIN